MTVSYNIDSKAFQKEIQQNINFSSACIELTCLLTYWLSTVPSVREPFQIFYKKLWSICVQLVEKSNYHRHDNSLISDLFVLETNWTFQQSYSFTWSGHDSIFIWNDRSIVRKIRLSRNDSDWILPYCIHRFHWKEVWCSYCKHNRKKAVLMAVGVRFRMWNYLVHIITFYMC